MSTTAMECDGRITSLMYWQGFIILLLSAAQILILNFSALKILQAQKHPSMKVRIKNYGLDLADAQIY